jgi:hypothetical protein
MQVAMPGFDTAAARVARSAFFVAMAAGVALIARASIPYFFGDDLHEFLIEKLPLPHEQIWLTALHVHVVAAVFSLPACLLLLSRRFLRRWPRVHRILGRVVGGIILLLLVPSGTWLAFYAKGGAPGTLGFLLSGAIVAAAMTRGIVHARARAFAAHRWCMLQVVGQLSVAITSRALLVGFDRAGIAPDPAYILALWLPVLTSALIAAFLGGSRRRNHATPQVGLALNPAR